MMFAVGNRDKDSKSIVYRNVSAKLIWATLITLAYVIGLFIVSSAYLFAFFVALFAMINIIVIWRVELKAMTNIQNIVVGDIFSAGGYNYMVISEKEGQKDNYRILCLQSGLQHDLLYIQEFDYT